MSFLMFLLYWFYVKDMKLIIDIEVDMAGLFINAVFYETNRKVEDEYEHEYESSLFLCK